MCCVCVFGENLRQICFADGMYPAGMNAAAVAAAARHPVSKIILEN